VARPQIPKQASCSTLPLKRLLPLIKPEIISKHTFSGSVGNWGFRVLIKIIVKTSDIGYKEIEKNSRTWVKGEPDGKKTKTRQKGNRAV